jgi:hypothetical protein
LYMQSARRSSIASDDTSEGVRKACAAGRNAGVGWRCEPAKSGCAIRAVPAISI